ncbi:unnamed protein product, partial [Ascophyllum nodosum]
PTPGCVNALRIKLSPRRAPASPTSGCVNALRIKLSPRQAQSPEHKRRLGEKKKRDGSPPPSCFFLPSSESKAVPLCGAAGSTTWYTGVGSRLFRGKGEEGWARSGLKELKNYRKRGASGVGGRAFWTEADCPHEEKDPRTLDFTVLNAMPALRHLDVSNNVLRRMEPADGQDLPPRLETLIMSHNNIPRISGIGRCCALRVINLSFNRIQVRRTYYGLFLNANAGYWCCVVACRSEV